MAAARLDAVIFDYGGVVIHEDPSEYDVIGAEIGLPKGRLWSVYHDIPEYRASRLGQISREEFRGAVRHHLVSLVGKDAASSAFERVSALYDSANPLRPEVKRLLQDLNGRARTGLLSNATRGTTERVRALGFLGLFDDVVFSGDVGVAKPDKEAFLLSASRLGVDPAGCLFVDDTPGHVQASVSVGMTGHVYHWSRHEALLELLTEHGLLAGTAPQP